MNCRLSAGTSSRAKSASEVQAGMHAPQSMPSAGSTYICVAASNPPSSILGWMQSTGQASTHSASLMQLSVMTKAMLISRSLDFEVDGSGRSESELSNRSLIDMTEVTRAAVEDQSSLSQRRHEAVV